MTPKELVALCRACAAEVYGDRPPSAQYAERASMLLAGTAAHESDGFKARRQYGYTYVNDGGAWGLWQTERAVLVDTRQYLASHPLVLRHVTTFVCQDSRADPQWLLRQYTDSTALLRWIACNDRMAVCQARLHYFQKPGAIPTTIQGQAEYWKHWYNTERGKGTTREYIRDWDRYIAPVWNQ